LSIASSRNPTSCTASPVRHLYAYGPCGQPLPRYLRICPFADRKSDGNPICSFEFSRDANGNPPVGGRFARGLSLREDGSCWYYDHDQDADAGFRRIGNPNVGTRNPKEASSPKARMTETSADQTAARDSMASPSAFAASCFDIVSDFDIRASDLCPATLRPSLVANGTPTYTTYNAANELLQEVTPGVETAYYSYDGRGNQTQRSVLGGDSTYYSYNSRNLITRIDSTQEGFTPNKFASRGPKRAGRRSFPLLTILMLRDTLASQDPLLPSGREPPCTRGRTNSVTVSLSRCPTIGHRRALPALLHT